MNELYLKNYSVYSLLLMILEIISIRVESDDLRILKYVCVFSYICIKIKHTLSNSNSSINYKTHFYMCT